MSCLLFSDGYLDVEGEAVEGEQNLWQHFKGLKVMNTLAYTFFFIMSCMNSITATC